MSKTAIYLEDTIEEIVRRLGIKDESFLTAQEKAIVKILRSMPPAQKELPDADSLNMSADCSDCIAHGGDFECDRIQCHKGTKLANLQQTLQPTCNNLPSAQSEKRTEERTETHGVCLDAISRQMAIDEIDVWIEAFKENGHRESASDAHFIRGGIGALPPAQPEQPWIPVSERPKKDGRYLVTRLDYVTDTKFIDILWYEKNTWWNRQATGDYAVTAWMPSPKPYKGDEDGNK